MSTSGFLVCSVRIRRRARLTSAPQEVPKADERFWHFLGNCAACETKSWKFWPQEKLLQLLCKSLGVFRNVAFSEHKRLLSCKQIRDLLREDTEVSWGIWHLLGADTGIIEHCLSGICCVLYGAVLYILARPMALEKQTGPEKNHRPEVVITTKSLGIRRDTQDWSHEKPWKSFTRRDLGREAGTVCQIVVSTWQRGISWVQQTLVNQLVTFVTFDGCWCLCKNQYLEVFWPVFLETCFSPNAWCFKATLFGPQECTVSRLKRWSDQRCRCCPCVGGRGAGGGWFSFYLWREFKFSNVV